MTATWQSRPIVLGAVFLCCVHVLTSSVIFFLEMIRSTCLSRQNNGWVKRQTENSRWYAQCFRPGGRCRKRQAINCDSSSPPAAVASSVYFGDALSLTCSIQVTVEPFTGSAIATWDIAMLGAAPCQWRTSAGIQTTSPGCISCTGSPSDCTRPRPVRTIKVWPAGWVCHAVHAPAWKVTIPPL